MGSGKTVLKVGIVTLAFFFAMEEFARAGDDEEQEAYIQGFSEPRSSIVEYTRTMRRHISGLKHNARMSKVRRWLQREREVADRCNPPIVVFFGGAFDSAYKPMEGLAERFRSILEPKGWKVYYYSWDHESEAYHNIDRYWWSYSEGRTPIILIGHSWGGETAYKVARRLPEDYRPLLVTLDPVSRFGGGLWLERPTKDVWFHVWGSSTVKNSFSRSELLAKAGDVIGHRWGDQPKADVSVWLNQEEPAFTHGDVDIMLKFALSSITEKAYCENGE